MSLPNEPETRLEEYLNYIASQLENPSAPEGTSVKSTGEAAGKVLTSDGSGGASWETVPTPEIEGADIKSTGVDSVKVLLSDGEGGAEWSDYDPTVQASDVDSGLATAGQVLTADGNGGATWATPSPGAGHLYMHLIKIVPDGFSTPLLNAAMVIIYASTNAAVTDLADLATMLTNVYGSSAALPMAGQLFVNIRNSGALYAIELDWNGSSVTIYYDFTKIPGTPDSYVTLDANATISDTVRTIF